jgi:hypothetical protein
MTYKNLCWVHGEKLNLIPSLTTPESRAILYYVH